MKPVETRKDQQTLMMESETPSVADLMQMVDQTMYHINFNTPSRPLKDHHRERFIKDIRKVINKCAYKGETASTVVMVYAFQGHIMASIKSKAPDEIMIHASCDLYTKNEPQNLSVKRR